MEIKDLYKSIKELICPYNPFCNKVCRKKCERSIEAKLVVLLGCGTGSPHIRHPKFKMACNLNTYCTAPSPGSFALTLKCDLNVQCVIYYCGNAVVTVDDDFAKSFWSYATKGIMKKGGWRKLSVAESVRRARAEIIKRYPKGSLNWQCAKNIHVVGDTQLP